VLVERGDKVFSRGELVVVGVSPTDSTAWC